VQLLKFKLVQGTVANDQNFTMYCEKLLGLYNLVLLISKIAQSAVVPELVRIN
jgi:hypothetical protein